MERDYDCLSLRFSCFFNMLIDARVFQVLRFAQSIKVHPGLKYAHSFSIHVCELSQRCS